MKQDEKIIEFLSIVFLTLAGSLGIFVTVLDFIGTDFVSGPWKWLKGTQPIILLTVATLTLALGLERYARFRQISRQLDHIEHLVSNSPERIIRSLAGVDVQQFKDTQEFYNYTAKRMREAKKTIDDMTWGVSVQQATLAAQKAFEEYFETLLAVCSKKTIVYREIMSFPPLHHLDRAETVLRENPFGYQLRYHELSKEKDLLPVITFMIIDSEEVIILSYLFPLLLADREEVRLAIRHPEIVRLFQGYYDTIWRRAKVLKERERVELATLQEIRQRLSQQ